jgi:hypothetical protein
MTSTAITSRSDDLAANICRSSPSTSVVEVGWTKTLMVLPVFLAHSSECFLQNSRSAPPEPHEMVMVAAIDAMLRALRAAAARKWCTRSCIASLR